MLALTGPRVWHGWKPLAFIGSRVGGCIRVLDTRAALAEASPGQRARARAAALIIGLVAAALYALTAHWAAGGRVNPGDSARFQYLPIVDGTPHPTGYPTYLMLSKLFYWALPFLPVSARITLLSVLCGACAVAVLFLVSHSQTGSMPASAGAAAMFGTSLTFWLVSTDAEVYALHVLFFVSVIWCLVHALRDPGAGTRALYAGLLLYAFSFGNHLTSIALAPAVAWTALAVEGKGLLRPRRLGLIIAFVLMGASQYAYIYFLSHRTGAKELDYVNRDVTLPELFQYMTGQTFGSRFFAFSVREVFTDRIEAFLSTARRDLSLGGLLVAAGGIVLAALHATRRRVFVMLMLALAGQLFVALNYRIEAGLYFAPAQLLLATMAAQCLASVNTSWFPAAVAVLVAATNLYQNTTSSRLSEPATPLLARVRWQSAQAAGCKQVLAAPSNYFTSKIRKYLRYASEYPGAEPYELLREIKAIDSLCVDGYWRDKLREEGGFYLPPQPDTLAAFLQRNVQQVVLVALWVESGLSSDARAALESLGGAPGGLGPNGAYVAMFNEGRLIAESRDVGGRAELTLKPGQQQNGFEPRRSIALVAVGKGPRQRTAIEIAGREQSSARVSFSSVVLDERQNVLGVVSGDANHLEDFHVFYRAQRMSDLAGVSTLARVVEATGVAGLATHLVDGIVPAAGSRWDCPECVKLDSSHASILIELPIDGQQGLTVFADNNDSFVVRCASNQRLLGSIEKVKPKGVRGRTLRFEQPCPKVLVELAESDGRASIGELEGWRAD